MMGQRGIPATHGGVEKAVQEIAVRMVHRGHRVTVLCRHAYTPPMASWAGVQIVRLPTIRQKNLDMIVHTLVGAIWSWFHQCDVVHLHGVDPAIVRPLISWRHPVVVTSHGKAYLREGWGALPLAASKYAESVFLSGRHVRTAVSRTLCEYYKSASGREVHYVPNGVVTKPRQDPSLVRDLGVEPGSYVLYVGRIDRAKGVHLLQDAFLRSNRDDLKLAIVGDLSRMDDYVVELLQAQSDRVVFLGFRSGAVLQALYDHCRLFVLPSYTEGLPNVLLEALASRCELVFSDLPPNIEIAGGLGSAFRCGDVDDLARVMDCALQQPSDRGHDAEMVTMRLREYDWDRIVDSYLESYREAITGRRVGTGSSRPSGPAGPHGESFGR